ncbi:hypothetical protein SAMN05518863_107125 [Candidatus Pantoea symbiotica]|uniref:Uncharacterized protein n=1 Tax=Candidatus Pantoea symbiotica TaxID=1884370 RepID=A0A1I3ZR98_9GAMM|nr:hypothetical protein [Enterobacter sp. Sphag1F]NYI16144.1 hypothetical protein [Enterobacter sp. Sphag71]SFK46069.1 hypothetical protein SAMN05518863_107125 [Pantoea symbiotica]SFU92498.1 hypothetical protein SAMN05518864_107200 [Pantoea sp. YR525]
MRLMMSRPFSEYAAVAVSAFAVVSFLTLWFSA